MRLKSIIFAVVAALMVVAAFAVAQQLGDGRTSPTPSISYWPMGGTDGTTNRVVRLDPNGILRTTEEYPAQYQTDRTTLCTNDTVRVGLKYMGFWYCAPWGQRTLYVSRTEGGSAVDLCYLYLYGSDDNLTYYPILQDAAWSDGVTAGAADTLLCDTLRVSLPMGFNAAKFTLPASVYPGRYLAIFAKRDSSTGSAAVRNFQTLTITAEGRMQ